MATEGTGEVVRRTRTWLERMVIGLDLCPFARGPYEQGTVRITVSEAGSLEDLMVDLAMEAERLAGADAAVLETTLLVHPHSLTSFADFNDALELVDAVLADRDLEGVIQVVAFHPELVFADTDPDAVDNFANRSPYPLLHLLRVDTVQRAAAGHPDVAAIPAANSEALAAVPRDQLERWRRGDP